MNKYAFEAIKPVEVLPLAARSASANGAAIDLREYEGDVLFTQQALPTGADANETLDTKVQDSADGSTDFAVYRSGTWYLYESSSPRLRSFKLGEADDVPVITGVVRQS